MSEFQIIEEYEGCTTENLKDILGGFKSLGFKQIINHRKITELIENSIYIFPEPIDEGGAFPHSEEVKFTATLPVHLNFVQEEFFPPSKETTGIIRFESQAGAPVGYYNEKSHILYLSDITHLPKQKALIPLNCILEVLERFKAGKRGFIGWLKEWGSKFQFEKLLMGADPEFEVVTADGDLIHACTVWPQSCHPKAKIGTDGNIRCGEFRPDPQDDPIKLTDKFEEIIKEVANHHHFPSDGKMCIGGGKYLETGGHIHISGIDPEDQLLDFLGHYVAAPMKQSMNRDEGGSGRIKSQGHSDWTVANSGRARAADRGEDHWEWRVLMAYHFDRETTNAVHCCVYCILETYRRKRGLLKSKPKPADYRKLIFYDKYKDHIEHFIEMFVKGVQVMEGIDVLDRWMPNRPKEKRVKFLCCNIDEGSGNYSGKVPEKIARMLTSLRKVEFKNMVKSRRCNIDSTRSHNILVAGLTDAALKNFHREIRDADKMIGHSTSVTLVNDVYGKFAWDFAFHLPKGSYQTKTNRDFLVNLISQAIQQSIDETDNPKEAPPKPSKERSENQVVVEDI